MWTSMISKRWGKLTGKCSLNFARYAIKQIIWTEIIFLAHRKIKKTQSHRTSISKMRVRRRLGQMRTWMRRSRPFLLLMIMVERCQSTSSLTWSTSTTRWTVVFRPRILSIILRITLLYSSANHFSPQSQATLTIHTKTRTCSRSTVRWSSRIATRINLRVSRAVDRPQSQWAAQRYHLREPLSK